MTDAALPRTATAVTLTLTNGDTWTEEGLTDWLRYMNEWLAEFAIEADAAAPPAEGLRAALEQLADSVDAALLQRPDGGNLLNAMQLWPEGSSGPIAVAAYETLVDRLLPVWFQTLKARVALASDTGSEDKK